MNNRIKCVMFSFPLLLCAMVLAEPQTQPATAPVDDASTPKGALKVYSNAIQTGDARTLRNCILTENPLEENAADTAVKLNVAMQHFIRAAYDRFGEAEADKYQIGGNAIKAPLMPIRNIDKLNLKIDGDQAVLTIPDRVNSPELKLRKVNGVWKLYIGQLIPQVAQAPAVIPVLNAMAKECEATAQDIRAGHFRTAEEAAAVMKIRILNAQRSATTKPAVSK